MSVGGRKKKAEINPFFYTNKAVYSARFFEVRKWPLFAPSVRDFIFELPFTSVESYARLCEKTSISLLSYNTETTRIIPRTRYF